MVTNVIRLTNRHTDRESDSFLARTKILVCLHQADGALDRSLPQDWCQADPVKAVATEELVYWGLEEEVRLADETLFSILAG